MLIFTLLVCLLIPLFLSIPSCRGFEYPPYTDTINVTDWFLQMIEDARIGIHSRLNQTDWFLDGWNLTDDRAQMRDYRCGLSGYTYGCVVAYEVTKNPYWLAEAKWLLDGYMRVQGETWAAYNKTWRLYRHALESHYGWLHHDSKMFMAMAKMNELGYSYPVVDLIDSAISVAMYNNSTDLGWEYYFPDHMGTLSSYMVNTFVPIMIPMAYLTKTGVKNYTNDLKRIYYVAEKFRIGDEYKYNFVGPEVATSYSLATVSSMLCARKYVANVFNDTQLQRSINCYGYPAFIPHLYVYMGVRVGVPALAQGFLVSDAYLRAIRMKYDLSLNQSQEFYYQDRYILFSRYQVEWWLAGGEFLYVLGQFIGTEISLPPIQMQRSGYYYYSSAILGNNTYLYSNPNSYLLYPCWSGGVLVSGLDKYPVATEIQDIRFNEVDNRFQAILPYEDSTFELTWDKYLFEFNVCRVSGTSKLPWKIMETNSFPSYTWHLMFTNGTLFDLAPANQTISAETTFALEIDFGNSAQWFLFKLDNSTLYQSTWSGNNNMKLTTHLSKLHSGLLSTFLVILDSPGDFERVREAVRKGLKRVEEGKSLTVPETIFPKTKGNIIHTDSNITAYQYDTAEEKMFITLSAEIGTNSTTAIYCDKGKPTEVLINNNKAPEDQTWSYDPSASILTVNATHLSTVDIVVGWSSIKANVKFNPDKLDLQKSEPEVINATIWLRGGYNVNQIDASTILVDNLIQATESKVERNTLVSVFNGYVVVDLIWQKIYQMGTVKPNPNKPYSIPLKISGKLCDGTRFEGTGYMKVLVPPQILDNNLD